VARPGPHCGTRDFDVYAITFVVGIGVYSIPYTAGIWSSHHSCRSWTARSIVVS
jgi:hypothetical protein